MSTKLTKTQKQALPKPQQAHIKRPGYQCSQMFKNFKQHLKAKAQSKSPA